MNKKRNVGVDAHIDQNKGITLVALVITIIVLLILAGITINLTVGQRGILTRAQEAGRNYQEAARKEDEDLAKFLGEADNIIAGLDSPSNSSEEKVNIVDGVPVPKGFEHTEGTKDTGFVIKDVSGTETNGNEFVWVPCTEDGANGSIKYDRYAFARDGWRYSQTKDEATGEIKRGNYIYTEPINTTELNSIKKYGGFYIGRYEVGVIGYDDNVVTSNSSSLTSWTGYSNGRAVVQANQQPWNYITRDKAKEVAEGMYNGNNVVISRLCSSYAWDTTLKFIETQNPGYAMYSIGDNYSGRLKNTGMGSTAVNNIYDMGGNVGEWTTEACSDTGIPYVIRSGYYNYDASDYPAGGRNSTNKIYAYDVVGFRLTLYVGLEFEEIIDN